MKDADQWAPSKFELQDGRLRASRDREIVGVGSRLITDLVAVAYQQLIDEHATGRLLDFGCGAIPLYETYRRHITESVCVDWSQSSHWNPHVDELMDLTTGAPGLDESSFDTILATDVLEHLPHPLVVWREFHRLLRPHGKVLLGVPFYYWLHEEPHDYHRYTEHALRRHASEAGLVVHEIRPYGGPLEILVDIVAKALSGVPLMSMLVTRLGMLLLQIPAVRQLSRSASTRMPLGYVGVFVKP